MMSRVATTDLMIEVTALHVTRRAERVLVEVRCRAAPPGATATSLRQLQQLLYESEAGAERLDTTFGETREATLVFTLGSVFLPKLCEVIQW